MLLLLLAKKLSKLLSYSQGKVLNGNSLALTPLKP
jgi:hypothetical protein